MSDDKGTSVKETIANEIKGAAVEVYRDGAQPAVREAGKTLGNATNLVLAPVNGIMNGLRNMGQKLASLVGRKVDEKVPPERQIAAPATIVGPAAMHYTLLGDGDDVSDLREMFENLLVTSMDRATAAQAHPAFVGMISQMTPDEAWILKSITQGEYPALHVQDHSAETSSRGLWSLLGHGIGIDESRLPQYISNLDRLGILGTDMMATTHAFDEIQAVVEAALGLPANSGKLSLMAARIYVTALGAQFLQTCVHVHVSPARYA